MTQTTITQTKIYPYTIRTDGVMEIVNASSMDDAAAIFGEDEFPHAEIQSVDDLLAHIESIDGAWRWIESDD